MLRRVTRLPMAASLICLGAASNAVAQTAAPPAATPAPTTATPAPTIVEPTPTTTAVPVEPTPAPAPTPEPEPEPPPPVAAEPTLPPLPLSDRELSAELGIAASGRSTVGGARITGRFLYQLAARDWFEGSALFTFGSDSAACFRDRNNDRICEHGALDGSGVELSFGVRRYFDQGGQFLPFARAAIGVNIARFANDDITGLALPLHVGGGLHITVAPRIAVVGQAELTLGFGSFGGDLGLEPQLGFGISAGAEFSLR